MKKSICLLLVFVLAVFSSCASSKQNEDSAEPEPVEEKKVYGNLSALGAESDENSSIPTISIVTDSGKAVTKKVYEGAAVSASGAVSDEWDFSDLRAQVKCRGNYTYSSTEKKSYRVRFDDKINLFNQGDGKARSWVLMAEHCDQSFLRNHIAFAMAKKLTNISYSSSSSFVHLIINGKDQGIYHVVEQHQVGKHRVDINEDPEIVDTDYFIEWDKYADSDGIYGINWFYAGENKFIVKSDAMSEAKCSFLSDFFNNANEAIAGGDESEIRKYLNVDTFVDMYILQEVMKNIDVGWSSFFFVKSAGGTISCTCPWDFDLAAGNDARLDNGSYEGLYVGNPEYVLFGGRKRLDQGNEWFAYLMMRTWFVDLVTARWDEVKGDMQDTAISEIDRISTCFADDIETNFKAWPRLFGSKINQEPDQIRALDTYQKHVAYLREWMVNRFTWLDNYFSDDSSKYLTTEFKPRSDRGGPGDWRRGNDRGNG